MIALVKDDKMAGTQMIVRIDPAIKSKASRLARSEGKTVTQVVRDLLADYVRDRDIEAYIDGLWDRAGATMRASGRSSRDVARVIKAVRAHKR